MGIKKIDFNKCKEILIKTLSVNLFLLSNNEPYGLIPCVSWIGRNDEIHDRSLITKNRLNPKETYK